LFAKKHVNYDHTALCTALLTLMVCDAHFIILEE